LRERYVLDDLRDYLFQSAGAILPKRDPVDSAFIQDVRNGTGRIKDVVGPVPKQIRWPKGYDVARFVSANNQVYYVDPTQSVLAGRYDDLDTLQIASGQGAGQKRAISATNGTTLGTNDTVIITCQPPPFSPGPNTSSDFDIILSYSDATRATRSIPPISIGSAPIDSDSDHIPDSIEGLIGTDENNGGGNEGALGDKDGDGYLNIEEWVILLYDYQKERLLKR
jgi:hypothetical protein